jgi:hypothetical protein
LTNSWVVFFFDFFICNRLIRHRNDVTTLLTFWNKAF